MGLILIILVCVLLFGAGGGYYAHNRYDGNPMWTGGGILVPILIVLLVLWALGGVGHFR